MADKTMDSSLLKVLEESRQSSNKAKWFYELMDTYYQDCIMQIGLYRDVPDDEVSEYDWPENDEVLLEVEKRPSGICRAIHELLDTGHDINGSDGGWNALMLSVGYADYYMTKYLIDHGADSHTWPDKGDLPEPLEQNYYLESLDIAYTNCYFESGSIDSGFIDAVKKTAELLASYGGLRNFCGICLKVDDQGTVSFSGPRVKF